MRKLKNEKGFSMIEILITMGLIGIIAAFAVPRYLNYQVQTEENVIRSYLPTLIAGFKTCMSAINDFTHCEQVNKLELDYNDGEINITPLTTTDQKICYLVKYTNTNKPSKGCIDSTHGEEKMGSNARCSTFGICTNY